MQRHEACYVWAYRSSDGGVCIHQIRRGGAGFNQTFSGVWDTGFSGFAPIQLPDSPCVWAYRASDGTACIHQIPPGGTTFNQVWQEAWFKGYDSFTGGQMDDGSFVRPTRLLIRLRC